MSGPSDLPAAAPHAPQHHHVAALEDGLAFVNTLELEGGEPVEHLPDLAAAFAWLQGHELVHADALEAAMAAHATRSARDLARLRRVRAALRELVEATVGRRAPRSEDLAVVNATLRTPARYELVLQPDGAGLGHRHEGDPLDAALALLAETVARAVSQGDPGRLRICANPGCRAAFVDRSRAGRRKWCDMATCGNRAKAARHRARRRAADAAGADA